MFGVVKDMVLRCSAVCFVVFTTGLCQLASAEENFAEESENVDLRFRRESNADLPQSSLLGSNLESSMSSSSTPFKSALVAVSLVALCVCCVMLAAWRYHPASLNTLRTFVATAIRRRRGGNAGLAFGPPVHRSSYPAGEPASSWAERLFRTQNEPSSGVHPLSFVDSHIDALQTSVNPLYAVDAVTLDDRYRPLLLM